MLLLREESYCFLVFPREGTADPAIYINNKLNASDTTMDNNMLSAYYQNIAGMWTKAEDFFLSHKSWIIWIYVINGLMDILLTLHRFIRSIKVAMPTVLVALEVAVVSPATAHRLITISRTRFLRSLSVWHGRRSKKDRTEWIW